MKALTVCQPYAEQIASGIKVIENRTWPTGVRGRVAIHAGKSRSWLGYDDDPQSFVYGAVVATAELYDCVRVEELPREMQEREDANGPWCFLLRNIQRIEPPIEARGAQGWWEWNEPAESSRKNA